MLSIRHLASVAVCSLALAGCASEQESLDAAHAKVLAEATIHCQVQGKRFQITSTKIEYPGLLTQGRATVQGVCLP